MVSELVAAVKRDADLPYSPISRDLGLRYELADRAVEVEAVVVRVGRVETRVVNNSSRLQGRTN